MNINKENPKPSELQDLSNKSANNDNSEDFLIDIMLIMKDNEEYNELTKKPNFGREEVTNDQKEIKEADNVYTIKHFIAKNYDKIRKDRTLQKEIQLKLERLRKIIVNQESTEFAQLMLLELQISGMLNEGTEED